MSELVMKVNITGTRPDGPCVVCGHSTIWGGIDLSTGKSVSIHKKCNEPLVINGGHVYMHTTSRNIRNAMNPNHWGIGAKDRSVMSRYFGDPMCREHLNLRQHGSAHEYYEWREAINDNRIAQTENDKS